MSLAIGDSVELTLDRVAHGGLCVGRSDGQVVFVRLGIPGERVRVEVTDVGSKGRFVRAEVTEVLEASPDRVVPACPHAVPQGCGGCDWQHVTIERQRAMKAEVVREQFVRFANWSPDDPLLTAFTVAPCGDDAEGLHWRTRMDFVANARGRLGLRAARSHSVIDVQPCAIAVAEINAAEALRQPWAAGAAVRLAATAAGVRAIPEEADEEIVTEQVGDNSYAVGVRGFWQAHRNAPRVFVQEVLELLAPRPGDSVLDLYGGVGLFALPLARAVGPGGKVVCVESDRNAARLARRNLRELPQAEVAGERVDRWFSTTRLRVVDLVVLDPPRTGAGQQVLTEVLRMGPRRVVYVACDPVALARDLAGIGASGYRVTQLRGIDAFPQTGHIETFALLEPVGRAGR